MRHKVEIRQFRDPDTGQGCGSVYVSGVGRVKTRVRANNTVDPSEVDVERLATIISIDRFLNLMNSKTARAVLPLPVEAVLALIGKLVKLKRTAILKGTPNAQEAFEDALEEAKESPNKAIRAVAAAALELLE